MNILFIQPYDLPKISSGKSRKAAYLNRTGFEVGYQVPLHHGYSLLDLNIAVHQGKTIVSSVRERILDEKPDVVFVTFPSFVQGFQVEAAVRAIRIAFDDCKIVLGGAAISLVKDAPLKWWNKYGISGCYNGFGAEIPDIINYLSVEQSKFLPRGFYTGKNDILDKGTSVLIDGYSGEELYGVPFLNHLGSFQAAGLQPIGLIEMMRGCSCHCNFCAINNERLGGCHFRSARTVASRG